MATEHAITIGWGRSRSGAAVTRATVSNTGEVESNLTPFSIAGGVLRYQKPWAFNPATAKSLFILSDKPVKLYINGIMDVQTITSPGSGTFTITKGANTTAAINFAATAATIQAALQGLASIGANNIIVTGPAGGPWVCSFAGALGLAPVTLMTVSAGSIAHTTTGVAPDQTLNIPGNEANAWWPSSLMGACFITATAVTASISNEGTGSASFEIRSVA